MTESVPPAKPRVRITAQTGLEQDRRPTPTATDVGSAYVRSLMRSQLKLALYCVTAFLGLLGLFVVGLNYFPELGEVRIVGVPLNWLLLGFGVYPLIVTTAVIYSRSARRNEAAYRALVRLEQADE